MSAYIQFFIRGGDTFYPIAAYSRSSAIYGIYDLFVPYESIIAIDKRKLDAIIKENQKEIDYYKERISKFEEKIEVVKSIDSPISEKMEIIDELLEVIEEVKEDIEEHEMVRTFSNFLYNIIGEAEDTRHYDNIQTIDPSKYVYAGIEVGQPTIEDIKEEKE